MKTQFCTPTLLLPSALLGLPWFCAAEPAPLTADFPGEIRLSLPEVIHATPGVETNLYFDNAVLWPTANPPFVFDVTCPKGVQQAERWTFTLTAEDAPGDFPLRLEVRDPANHVVARATSTLRLVEPFESSPRVEKTLLILGDSLTAASAYSQHLLDLAASSDSLSLTLIGTRGAAENRHEGYGGWTAARFATRYTGIARGGPYKECGSPFLYQEESDPEPRLDFDRYCREFNPGKGAPDFVTILLGCNDTFSATDETIEARIDTMFKHYERLIDMIHDLDSQTRIGALLLVPPAASQDAFGQNYGTGQTRWQYKRNQHRVVERMLELFGGREAENLFLVPAHLNLDTVNGYPFKTVPANARTSREVRRLNNGVHPSAEGYRQIGDSIWCWLQACLAVDR